MTDNIKINCEIVADSLNPQGDRLTSVLATFPRFILAEINTHRMLSKNTSSSRAIPFKKMIEVVQENPFIPIAWQKEHKGMQGSEYFNSNEAEILRMKWLRARDRAIESALDLAAGVFDVNEVFEYDEEGELIVLQTGIGVTKQLVNRLLEPFMWTTMLITGSKEGWDNFFELRCPAYEFKGNVYGSKKDVIESVHKPFRFEVSESEFIEYKDVFSDKRFWQKINKGQAEIHIMDLAERIYDAMNESTPKQLQAGEWHIPFEDRLPSEYDLLNHYGLDNYRLDGSGLTYLDPCGKIKISTAMAARTSYTVVGDEKEINYERMIGLHDRLIAQNPPHSSPMEHCARAMSGFEYQSYIKGELTELNPNRDFNENIEIEEPLHKEKGWCRNFKGFIQYRHLVENRAA